VKLAHLSASFVPQIVGFRKTNYTQHLGIIAQQNFVD